MSMTEVKCDRSSKIGQNDLSVMLVLKIYKGRSDQA